MLARRYLGTTLALLFIVVALVMAAQSPISKEVSQELAMTRTYPAVTETHYSESAFLITTVATVQASQVVPMVSVRGDNYGCNRPPCELELGPLAAGLSMKFSYRMRLNSPVPAILQLNGPAQVERGRVIDSGPLIWGPHKCLPANPTGPGNICEGQFSFETRQGGIFVFISTWQCCVIGLLSFSLQSQETSVSTTLRHVTLVMGSTQIVPFAVTLPERTMVSTTIATTHSVNYEVIVPVIVLLVIGSIGMTRFIFRGRNTRDCSSCGSRNPEGNSFCMECGNPLTVPVPPQ